jgi:hypothetical protein
VQTTRRGQRADELRSDFAGFVRPVLVLGGALVWLGQSRSFGTIQQALAPEKDTVLVDALRAQRRLNRGPSIVAIGGGTGLATLLSGLKR